MALTCMSDRVLLRAPMPKKKNASVPNPVTSKEIARRSGFSQSLVSRILNGDPAARASETTRKSILSAAIDLGYKPNLAARAMRTGKFGSVALILSRMRSHSLLPDLLLGGLHDALAAEGLHLTVAQLADENLRDASYVPRILNELFVDGLLINYNDSIPPRMIELISKFHVPSVWLNSIQPQDAIYPDDEQGAQRLTEHLIREGHKRICYVNFFGLSHYSSSARKSGYLRALEESRLRPDVRVVEEREAMLVMRQILDRVRRPTAIVTYSPNELHYVLDACRRLNIGVPSDLAVATFDERPFRYLREEYFTAIIPEQEVGARAVEMLLDKVKGTRSRNSVAVPYTVFTPGTTTAFS